MPEFHMEWEPDFEQTAWHFRSSMNPLGDVVRQTTDEIHRRVKAAAEAEAARWKDTRDTTKGLLKKSLKQEKLRFFRARGMAYSLDVYVKTLRAVMVKDGEQNYGMVASYHAAGDRIEFGGKDPTIRLSKTGEVLDYPAFGFLRRGVNG